MSWLGLGLQLLGTYNQWKSEREQAKAQGRQMAEQAKNAITTMNYAFQNYEEERRDAFETGLANLEKLQINSSGLIGSVENAVSEGMGDSKTGRLLSRATHAEALRTALSEKDTYTRRSNEIDLNKEQQLVYTKSYTAGLHPPKLPSKGELFFRLANAGFSWYSQMQNKQAFQQSHFGTTGAQTDNSSFGTFSMSNYNAGTYNNSSNSFYFGTAPFRQYTYNSIAPMYYSNNNSFRSVSYGYDPNNLSFGASAYRRFGLY